jgi:hypothetical protein
MVAHGALIGLLCCVLGASCGDDDADGDAGSRTDAGARDAQVSDARAAGDAGVVYDAGMDGDAGTCPGIEPAWLVAGPAVRASFDDVCGKAGCPATWSDALASAGDDDADAGAGVFGGCYFTTTGCGVDTLFVTWGTHTKLWHYDHDTGELIGAADQFTDLLQGRCDFIERHAGRNDRPVCRDLVQKPLPSADCWPNGEDAGP